MWILNNIQSEYNRKKGIYTYILDGNTGELLIVKQFTGKGPNPKYPKSGTIGLYETIYERK